MALRIFHSFTLFSFPAIRLSLEEKRLFFSFLYFLPFLLLSSSLSHSLNFGYLKLDKRKGIAEFFPKCSFHWNPFLALRESSLKLQESICARENSNNRSTGRKELSTLDASFSFGFFPRSNGILRKPLMFTAHGSSFRLSVCVQPLFR